MDEQFVRMALIFGEEAMERLGRCRVAVFGVGGVGGYVVEALARCGLGALDLIDHDTRFDILENKVTLVVPEGNPKNIQSFDDLASHLQAGDILMVMGNSDVPVGQYTQKILAYYNLDEETLASAGTITYATNVKEVTSQVSAGSADCGVIYQTDAYSAGLAVVDSATKDMCGRVVYPAAATKAAPNPEGARAFLDFLKGDEATADFSEVGFTPLANA